MSDTSTKLINTTLIIIGILSASLGLEGFLVPNQFIDGGVTGSSMFLSELTEIPLFVLILVINTPFVIIGYKQIGKNFSLRSAVAIVGLSISIFLFHFLSFRPLQPIKFWRLFSADSF